MWVESGGGIEEYEGTCYDCLGQFVDQVEGVVDSSGVNLVEPILQSHFFSTDFHFDLFSHFFL